MMDSGGEYIVYIFESLNDRLASGGSLAFPIARNLFAYMCDVTRERKIAFVRGLAPGTHCQGPPPPVGYLLHLSL